MKFSRCCYVGLFVLCLAPAQRLFAQANAKTPDPEEERKSFQVADGFEVTLFAADPLLAKPIQMNFDPQGRLWIASSEVYPQIAPGQKADDKILILEDTKGVGVADKTTVFTGGLLIPTGVEPGDGGAYVANSTELLFFKDGGDGHAASRRILLSGFGTEDTHHILHTLRWGYDGMLYFNQSIYIHSHIETPWGVRRLNGGGIWQFRPESMQLEIFSKGWVNPWGHHFNRFGADFVTDGAGGEGINYTFPGGVFTSSPNAPRILAGLNPGSPKECGLEILSGRHLPDAWQGNLITNDFRAHRVCRYIVTEEGSGFVSREQPELIKTNYEAFRPIDVKMGPDGAIYIADWYNPIINHGEVDFRDPRRDHTHGRIWRVTAKGRPLVAKPKLVGAPVVDLLNHLKDPENYTRIQAKRVLKERGASEVLPVLADWVQKLDPNDPEYDHQRLEALWTYQSLDRPNGELLASLARSADYNIKAAVARVAGAWQARLPDALGLLASLVNDEHPRVRLEAVRALAGSASPHAAELVMQALDRPVDKFLDFAIWEAARDLQPLWLPALQAGEIDFGGNVRHLTFALQATGSRDAVPALVKLLQSGKLSPDRADGLLVLLAGVGGPHELSTVFKEALKQETPASRRVALLNALAQAARERKVFPAGDRVQLEGLLSDSDEAVQRAGIPLVGLWKVEPLRSRLVDWASKSDTSEALRSAAFAGLATLGGGESVSVLSAASEAKFSPAMRRAAVAALAELDLGAAASRAVTVLRETPADDGTVELVTAFLSRKGAPAALAAALQDQKLPADVARLGVRAVRTAAREEPVLLAALNRAGELKPGPRLLNAEELKQLYAEVAAHGNPARGELIFRRANILCMKCHSIGGAGGQVGPDLMSIGASTQVDYLVESILEPNKKIKEGFHAATVLTNDGRVITGIKLRQTDKDLLLRDAEDHEVAIPLESIEAQKDAGSLMPAGLADNLTQAELADLVRFLTELGRIGPFAISKAPLARRWQTLTNTPANVARDPLSRNGLAALLSNDPAWQWQSIYSKVSGDLPLRDAFAFSHGNTEQVAVVRAALEVTTPGKLTVQVNSTAGLKLFVDGQPTPLRERTDLELGPGMHQFLFVCSPRERTDPLRLELVDVAGSAAKARWLNGK
ncbi:MAG TPA: PVC-type heme-binding CxxCH protein [Pirellulales bacterium]|jgi:putative heme-binding domain-containing protein|nr:PVC-type heme-binding CxxCH protein [Pirellulales bacterium]